MPAGAILTFAAARSTAFAEWYATAVYPPISSAINFVASWFPFSLGEVMVLLALPLFLAYLAFSIYRIVRDQAHRRDRFVRLALNPACAACILFFVYVLTCGLNYYRLPFGEVSGLDVHASSTDELAALYGELVDEVNSLRPTLPEDESCVMRTGFADYRSQAEEARESYQALGEVYPTLRTAYRTPKPVFFSRGMSYLNITGIFFPFTCEANVNTDVPAYTIPATMCHELTHLRGYMREDEANFLAYLACRESGSEEFRYSGLMLALVYTGNALYGADEDAYWEQNEQLCDGAKRDIWENSRYWKQFEGPVAEVSSAVNDSYLKANQQQDGVKSYGRMVDLLLADYRARHGLTL